MMSQQNAALDEQSVSCWQRQPISQLVKPRSLISADDSQIKKGKN